MCQPFQWVKRPEEVAELIAVASAGPVALDLEADSFHHYREKVCLLQITAGGRNFLMDPLDGAEPRALAGLLADPGIRKILHGADYDLRLLHRDHGLEVRALFDTMVAARLTGARSFGLGDLLREHLGVELDKSHQRADWSRRPIPEAMLRYAVLDTAHLAALARKLEHRLETLGRRAWAEEEFDVLEQVRWSSQGPDPEAFRRVKGSRRLDARGLRVLRSLHAFRDDVARHQDVPPFRVLSDAALVELARRRPAQPADLAGLPGLSRSLRQGGPRTRRLLETIREGERHEPVPLRPPLVEDGRRQIAPEVRRRLGTLRNRRDRLAARLDLEPSVLASRRLLEGISERLEAGEPWDDLPGLRRWQAGLLGEIV